jgi:glycosyltransferase involved in cell wall biosynthesis
MELIRRVGERYDIHLVVVSKTVEEDLRHLDAVAEFCRTVEVFPAAPPAPEELEDGYPRQIARHRSPAATGRIGEILAHEPVDLVHVEGFYLMQHVPDWVPAPVLLVEQNVEYDLERQRAATAEPGVTQLASFSHCVRTQAAEIACWRRAGAIGALTPEDAELIAAARPGVPVTLLPDGADHIPSVSMRGPDRELERPDAPLVVFLANFAYGPNVDAARHLCRDIMPRVRAAIPHVQTWLVGNAPPPEVRELERAHTSVTGFVPDVLPYLDAADVAVCPLRIGGGIKVKAIEALRRGRAMVSTPVGAQGLGAQARDALVVCERAEPFAHAVGELLLDGRRRAELEWRAAEVGTTLPTWDQAAEALSATYDGLLRQSQAAAGSGLAARRSA